MGLLYLYLYHSMKAYRGRNITTVIVITSAPPTVEWLTSRSGSFTPGENSDTHRIGGWLGHRSGLDILEKRIVTWPCRDSNLVSSSL
jgi:hypothetical protein